MGKKELTPKIRFAGFTDPWEQRKVGDYYEFKNGLNKGKEFFGSGTPIVNFTDVFHNRGIETAKLKGRVTLEPSEIKNYEVKKGDLFFTRTSETIEEIGYPSVMLDEPENTVFSGFVLRGRCFLDQDPLDDLFKKYVFFTESFRNEMLKKSSMTTRALTSGTSIKEMVFFHPSSKVEQRKIGELLSQIDNSITLHQRKYEKLQNIKKSMLEKMFPRDGGCIPEVRFAGFTDPWEQRKLGEIVHFSKGTGYSKGDLKESGTPIILYGRLYTRYETVITDVDTFADPKSGSVFSRGGEVIVPASGETAEDISIASVVEKSGVLLGGDLNIITPPDELDSAFLAISISNGKPHNDMAKMAQGKSVVHLHNTDLEKIDFVFPSHNEQVQISTCFKRIDNLITLHQRKLEKLKNIKKSMLENMFV